MMLRDVIVDGAVSAEELSARMGTTQAELARSTGLGRDAVLRCARLASPTTQRRLREMAEVVARIEDWAGSPMAAYAWYRATPLPEFGGRTAETLVREGRADAVRRYLDEVALGGFACRTRPRPLRRARGGGTICAGRTIPSRDEGPRQPGRLNRPGEPTLYLALAPETAIREVQAGFAHRFQPLTLCAYEVRALRIADLRNAAVMTGLGFDPAAPACDWRLDVAEGRKPSSWRLADGLRTAGAQGVLIPSYAMGAGPRDLNLILWAWNEPDGVEVAVIDDHARLPPRPDTT